MSCVKCTLAWRLLGFDPALPPLPSSPTTKKSKNEPKPMSVLVSFPNSLLKYSCSTCTQNHILILKPDTPSYTQPCVCVFSLQFSVSLLWWRREEKLNYLTTVPLVMCLLLHGNTVVLHSWLHMHIFIYRYIFFETLTHSQHTLAINNKNRPIPLLTQWCWPGVIYIWIKIQS